MSQENSSGKFDNVVIFVSDALRYDHYPRCLQGESGVIETLAPSLHTPTSFASILTGISPENHNISGFMEELDADFRTVFNYFENSGFYDGLDASTVNNHIGKTELKDLFDMDEPFLWVERMLDTHAPYGQINHERDFDGNASGRDYIERCKKGELDIVAEYPKGVEFMEEYVSERIDEMKERGILQNTLVIITSDHGEALGERFLGRKRYDHNYPPMRQISIVPTVFYNHDLGTNSMRSIDIVPTALSLAGKEPEDMDGRDLTSKEPAEKGVNFMDDIKCYFENEWVYREGWRPTKKSKVDITLRTILGDIKRDVYRVVGKPMKNSVEEYFEDSSKDNTEIEGIEI